MSTRCLAVVLEIECNIVFIQWVTADPADILAVAVTAPHALGRPVWKLPCPYCLERFDPQPGFFFAHLYYPHERELVVLYDRDSDLD
jgi:hypothetical protein